MLSDLDELVLKCRDDNAKNYIRESVACYKSGAFRSAIVSTWIAVAFDLIDKIKELSLTGDKEADIQLTAFEKARRDGDISRSLSFERDLLKIAKEKLELISHIEFIDLERLQQDRNRCAHPSMTSDSEIFNPSAELARVHIRSAVEYLLQYPPAQGKYALQGLVKEVDSDYFPLDLDKAITAFKSSPLCKARDSLITNFIIILLKKLINEQLTVKAFLRIFTALNAIEEMHKSIYDITLNKKLTHLLKSIEDDKLFKVIPIIKRLPDSWFFLDESIKQKVESYVENLPRERFSHLDFLLSYPPLFNFATTRLNNVTRRELIMANFSKLPLLVKEKVVDLYVNSSSFDEANYFSEMIVKYSNEFTKDQVKTLIKACGENYEIKECFQISTVIFSLGENININHEEINMWLNKVGLTKYVMAIPEVDICN